MATPRKVDYDRIEPLWRAGLLSPRQIAEAYTKETGDPLSHAAVIKHFNKQGTPRDLSAKIRAKTEELVTRATVTEPVTPESKRRDTDIVQANATVAANILLDQRSDVQRGRKVVMGLLGELEQQVGVETAAMLQELGELMRAPDESGMDKLNDLYRKIISLPGRAKTMKDLGDSLEKMVKLERQAFGLDNAEQGDGDPMAGGRTITDAERAVRLLHFLRQGTPAA